MSTANFVKGECRQCAGHLEFPADAVGKIIECPHCGQPTELVEVLSPSKTSRFQWILFSIGVFIGAAGIATGFFLIKKSGRAAVSEASVPPLRSTNNSTAPVRVRNDPNETRTNDFGVSAIKLDKTEGSSLVYATGKIRNLSSNRRFGVKVELNLFDTNNNQVGQAKDYQPLLEPGAEWHFKAMVMESKAASAKLNSVLEDR